MARADTRRSGNRNENELLGKDERVPYLDEEHLYRMYLEQRQANERNMKEKFEFKSELDRVKALLDESQDLLERLIESFNYALDNNLKLTPSKQYGKFLFLLDDSGRMIFKFTKEYELLQKLKGGV